MDVTPPSRLLSAGLVVAAGLWLSHTLILKLRAKLSSKSRLPLPPGPKGLPLIGNLLDLPTEQQWLKATEWSKEYGEIVHVNAVGQHIVYLNTYEVALDLLEGRSAKHSDRPSTEMMKLSGADRFLAFMPYGEKWRMVRRIFHQEFNSNTTAKYLDEHRQHCRSLLQHIYMEPESFEHYIKNFSSGTILESVYGIQIQRHDDPYVRGVEIAMGNLEILVLGIFLVDFFPFLKYVPNWLPGAAFKRKASKYAQDIENHYVPPFQAARAKMALNPDSSPNMTTRWMDKIDAEPDGKKRQQLESCLRLATGVTLVGGYESTTSTLIVFIYLMIMNPDVQAKLQAELDAVVGRSRLPDFSDKEHLQYVDAVYKELIRWHPVAPLGIPHRSIVEDEYKGMRIPKGSIMAANMWAMTRDEAVYGADTDSFRPERFLESDLPHPSRVVFGFGRRICPGRYFAESGLFLAIASLAHSFKISKAVDRDGMEITPEARWESSVVARLEPYPCSITPRFDGVGELLRSSEDGR